MKNSNNLEKLKCRNDLKELTELVNEWDPVGLILCGAPKDEYDCLVGEILSLLYRETSLQEIQDFVIKELNEHFGHSVKNKEDLILVINKINNWYQNSSCKKNESKLVDLFLENELKGINNFKNAHGITIKNIDQYKVEPFKVLVEGNTTYNIWIVIKENKDTKSGYVIGYNLNQKKWVLSIYVTDDKYLEIFQEESLREILENM